MKHVHVLWVAAIRFPPGSANAGRFFGADFGAYVPPFILGQPERQQRDVQERYVQIGITVEDRKRHPLHSIVPTAGIAMCPSYRRRLLRVRRLVK